MKRLKLIFVIVLCIFSLRGYSQFYSARTNIVGLGTGNINAEFSMTLDKHFSLHFPVQYNPFTYNRGKNTKFKNLTILPAARYWFLESFREQFVGVSLVGSRYNISNIWDSRRYDGYAAGLGISYGWAYPIASRWNIEWEVGVAGMWCAYDKYVSKNSGYHFGEYHQWRIVPHKFALNLTYLF
ncbi:DUF3575 domain-containing protein [Bacteroides sp. 51]|uniref:DUF3575 domain-containing protein n=1 Tax=Bacteroides sp. 51 TaxID=2302938 RepID=UPI0013D76694|nr:DUF3575 domain-containing protein [Bacteroides sp. 51]NDV83411.1 DUF3575 domain-containing protein [Bacteroides sp. 51]